MDPSKVEQTSAFITSIEGAMRAHPMLAVIAIAIVISWTTTSMVKHVMRALLPDDIQDHVIRLFDCLVAGLVAWRMWPAEFPGIGALFVAGLSPIAYWVVSEALCWKWPGLRKFLTLGELVPPLPPPVAQVKPPEDKQ